MLTNKLNLPEPFLRAAEAAMYSKGDARYSVTELIRPARIAALQRYYKDVIVEDVADSMPSLIGRMFHLMLKQAGAPKTGAILEERLYAEVDGVRISGAMDHTLLWDNGLLDDYKSCSVYAVMAGGKEDWVAQVNVYRWLRALHGQQIERLRVIAWMRDWMITRMIADYEKNGAAAKYPPHDIAVIDIPVWSLEETEAYVKTRIAAHLEADDIIARLGPDADELARCHETQDCWRTPLQWAVMKPGRKTALKRYDTKAEAEFVAAQEKGGYIEPRGGVYRRCLLYCPVGRAGLCAQWEAIKAEAPTAQVIDTSAFD